MLNICVSLSFLSFIFSHNSLIPSNTINYQSDFLVVTESGEFFAYDQCSNPIWHYSIGKPLVNATMTKSTESLRMIPALDGTIYILASNDDTQGFAYTNATIYAIVNESPFITPAFPKVYITGSKIQTVSSIVFDKNFTGWINLETPHHYHNKTLLFSINHWTVSAIHSETNLEQWSLSYADLPPFSNDIHIDRVNGRVKELKEMVSISPKNPSTLSVHIGGSGCMRRGGMHIHSSSPSSIYLDHPSNIIGIYSIIESSDTDGKLSLLSVMGVGPLPAKKIGVVLDGMGYRVGDSGGYIVNDEDETMAETHAWPMILLEAPVSVVDVLNLGWRGVETLKLFNKRESLPLLMLEDKTHGLRMNMDMDINDFHNLKLKNICVAYSTPPPFYPLHPSRLIHTPSHTPSTTIYYIIILTISILFTLIILSIISTIFSYTHIHPYIIPLPLLRFLTTPFTPPPPPPPPTILQPYDVPRMSGVVDHLYLFEWQGVGDLFLFQRKLASIHSGLIKLPFVHHPNNNNDGVKSYSPNIIFIGRNIDEPNLVFRNPRTEISHRPSVPRFSQAIRNALSSSLLRDTRTLKAYVPRSVLGKWNGFEGVFQDYINRHQSILLTPSTLLAQPALALDLSFLILLVRDIDPHEENYLLDCRGRVALFDLGYSLADRPLLPLDRDCLINFEIFQRFPQLLYSSQFSKKQIDYLGTIDIDKLTNMWTNYKFPDYVHEAIAQENEFVRLEELNRLTDKYPTRLANRILQVLSSPKSTFSFFSSSSPNSNLSISLTHNSTPPTHTPPTHTPPTHTYQHPHQHIYTSPHPSPRSQPPIISSMSSTSTENFDHDGEWADDVMEIKQWSLVRLVHPILMIKIFSIHVEFIKSCYQNHKSIGFAAHIMYSGIYDDLWLNVGVDNLELFQSSLCQLTCVTLPINVTSHTPLHAYANSYPNTDTHNHHHTPNHHHTQSQHHTHSLPHICNQDNVEIN